jgi:hypothetical protein
MRNKAFSSGKPWTGLSPDRLGVTQTISDDAPRQTLAASRAASKES